MIVYSNKTKDAMLIVYLAMTAFLFGGLVIVATNQTAQR